MDSFIKQLTSSSYWTLNKDLCRQIGLENTLLLQHFIDLQYKVFGGNEFYQQQERIQEELNFTEYQVKKCINFLCRYNLISVDKKGHPAKNYYLINELNITRLVSSNSPNQSDENHLTSQMKITQQKKELNKKELNKKELNKKELNNNNIVSYFGIEINLDEVKKDIEYNDEISKIIPNKRITNEFNAFDIDKF